MGTASHAAATSKSGNLDVLRAFAVSAVFFGHLIQSAGIHNSVVGHVARFGVLAFFVHTCMVLMQSLERLSTDGLRRVTLRFYVRRFFRIYPLAIVCVACVVLFKVPNMPWRPYEPISPLTVVSNYLLIENLTNTREVLAPLWSLPFEVQMYVLLPVCYFLLRKGKVNAWVLLSAGVLLFFPGPAAWRANVKYFPCFLAGILSFQLTRAYAPRLRASWYPLALLFICLAYAWTAAYVVRHGAQQLLLIALDWICSLSVALAIPPFAELPHSWFTRGAQRIAEYSYSIYLSHVPVMWVALVVLANHALLIRLLVLLIGSTTLPFFAYRWIERPMIQLGASLATRLSRPEFSALPLRAPG